MTDPLAFSLAALALLVMPGPTNALLATSGAMAGLRRSGPLLLAVLLGYIVAVGALHLGLGPLVQGSPAVQAALRIAVGIYLVATAARLWWRPAELASRDPVGPARIFVVTLLNPKALVFAFVVLPLDAPDPAAYLAAFAAFVILAASAWSALGALLGRRLAMARPRLVPRVSALVLCAFAAGLLAG
jgi:threonine/homoserine/homoserine lactone efflux protein